ncbi:HAD-IA family hydrolase [bacterium]|nr:HAD-IA family hydrolase [bacterium]
MIKTVVFDVGGVLAYDVWEHVMGDPVKGLAVRLGLDPRKLMTETDELWHLFSMRPAKNISEIEAQENEYWTLFREKFAPAMTVAELIEISMTFFRPVPGMPQLVRDLAANGVEMAICSNNNEFWFLRQMAACGLNDFFEPEKIILSSGVEAEKSSPGREMFHAVAGAIGNDVSECVFIDDRFRNIERALNFGMQGLLFPPASSQGCAYARFFFSQLQLL